MPEFYIDKSIAERELTFLTDQGIEKPSIIRIGNPFFSKKHQIWQCPYEIDINGEKNTYGIYGIDSLQAMVIALKAVDTMIPVLEQQNSGCFLFEGSDYKPVFDLTERDQ